MRIAIAAGLGLAATAASASIVLFPADRWRAATIRVKVTLAGYEPLEFTYWLVVGAPESGRVMRRARSDSK